MQLYIEIILLPVRKKLYLVKNDQELTVSSRYRVSELENAQKRAHMTYNIMICENIAQILFFWASLPSFEGHKNELSEP